MRFKTFGAALLAAGILAAPAAQAQTEIQWWHSMTGALNDRVDAIANGFNASQKDYKVVPVYKGAYPESMTAAIAAFRAGNAPHILQVFEVGTATMMAAKGAIKPVYDDDERRQRAVRSEELPCCGRRLLHRQQGQHALDAVQQLDAVFYINKDAFKKAGLDADKAPTTWTEFAVAAAKLKASGPAMRVHHGLAVVGAHRELQRLAQPADRHQGERHRRHRHGVHRQFAAARRAHRRCWPTMPRRAGSPIRGGATRPRRASSAANARCSLRARRREATSARTPSSTSR